MSTRAMTGATTGTTTGAVRVAKVAKVANTITREALYARETEKQWQARVVKLARLMGWLCYHAYDSRRSESGYPDLTCVGKGRVVYIELKTERGKLSPAQEVWLERLRGCPGVEVYVFRPSHWYEVQDVLR